MRPLLSVIMPTYNGEKFVPAAMESIAEQYSDAAIELVVVDDGSSDRTLEIINQFSNLFSIRIITPGRIGNWVAASNLGLREATGEWACFLHQDDLWLPGRLARLRREMDRPDVCLVLHNAVFVGPDGQGLGPWTCPLPTGTVMPEEFIEHLLIQNFIAVPSPMFRRKAVIDSGGMDETLWFTADWDLWLRLGSLGPICFTSEALSAFRIHPDSQTIARERSANEWEKQLITVLARHLPVWATRTKDDGRVLQVAMASVAVNSLLSRISRSEPLQASAAIQQLLALGPAGWHRYLRDSRIVQRVRSRMKVRGLTLATRLQ